MKRRLLVATEADARSRLDVFLSKAGGISRGEARRVLERGGVWVDGKRVKVASRGIHPGQRIEVVLAEAGRDAAPLEPGGAPVEVLFEDTDVLAVNKPPFVDAQASKATDGEALTARVAHHLGLRSADQVGLVHRLDRETSGVTIFGKRPEATAALAAVFREGRAQKRYVALASRLPVLPARVEAWLGKDPSRPGSMRVVPADGAGVPATTRVELLASVGPEGPALVSCHPETGRTHQIRVHLQHLGAPLVGDDRYGGPREVALPGGEGVPFVATRVLLHALSLTVPHPRTGEPLTLRAPLPGDLAAAAAQIGFATDSLLR